MIVMLITISVTGQFYKISATILIIIITIIRNSNIYCILTIILLLML